MHSVLPPKPAMTSDVPSIGTDGLAVRRVVSLSQIGGGGCVFSAYEFTNIPYGWVCEYPFVAMNCLWWVQHQYHTMEN
jgi:hypothetical protein